MTDVFKSILFKYKNNLYLGLLNNSNIINEFKPIKYTDDTFKDLTDSELLIALIEKNESLLKIHSIETVPLYNDDKDQSRIVVGDMDQDDLFSTANSVLEDSKKKKLH